ncbi:MAG: NAD(P)/FAD-dependent oxidoreductase [Lentisphaerae bacterium]|nr:NAD(P)/FAD-dependent oxidoreductase [Lentisphaerota bacterium]
MYDIVIIGGGVIGCAIARELKRWRLKVALCERSDDVGAGASKANSAIVHPGHSAKPGTDMARLNVVGNQLYDQLCQELDITFQRCGSLTVAFDEDELPALESVYQDGLANGVPGMRLIDRDELLRREPNLNPEAVAALFAPTGGIVCPYELTVGLAENAAINGVDVFLNTKAVQVKRNASGWTVCTGQGDFDCAAVVNAAGLYADIFNNQVSTDTMRIIPRRGEYWMIDKSFDGAFRSTIFQLPGKMGKGVLVSPTVDGTIIVGPNAEDIDDRDDNTTTRAGLEYVYQAASRIWPALPRRALITNFAGNRAHLVRHDFVLGEAPGAPGFFNAAGIESPGLTAAPAIARELSAAIAEYLHASPNAEFQPCRPPVRRFRNMTMAERAAAIAENPAYGRIICRCEQVTEAEIRDCIRRPVGARSVDGVKRRTRAGMGRCQGGFCMPRVVAILSEELGVSPLQITKNGGNSIILTAKLEAVSREREAEA